MRKIFCFLLFSLIFSLLSLVFSLSPVSAYTILEDLSVKGSVDLSGYNLTFGSDAFNLGKYISLNFNQGGSSIYDDTNLHIKTDDNLWLDAPGTTYMENDMALKGNTLTLAYDSNNTTFVNLGKTITLNFNQGESSIYDDTNLHLKTDDNMWLDVPDTVYVENQMILGGDLRALSFIGPLTGDVLGNLTGIVTGTLIGNVTGDISGLATGLTGDPDISVTDLTATGTITFLDDSLTDSVIPDTITASNYLPLSGGTLSGDLNLGTNNITNINSLTATSLFGGLTGDVTGSLSGGSINTTGFTFNSGATAGYVLTTNASGVGFWTDLSSTGGPWTLSGSNLYPDDTNYNVGIGTTSPSAKLHSLATTEQLRLGYDDSNYTTFTVNDTGDLLISPNENTGGIKITGNSWGPNIIGGYAGNVISAGLYGVFIGAGGSATYPHNISASYAFIGSGQQNTVSGLSGAITGGRINTASGYASFIGGGIQNVASNNQSTVGGGYHNTASGDKSTVSGGSYNTASGLYSTVPGGLYNTASGDYTFAVGRRAKATTTGAFALTDSTDADFTVETANVFGGRFSGGYWLTGGNVGIGTTSPSSLLTVQGTNSTATEGSELLTQVEDRDFSGAGNWSGTNWTVTGGVATHTAGANEFVHTLAAAVGTTYQIKATVVTTTAGELQAKIGGVAGSKVGQSVETLTQHTWVFTATSTDTLRFVPNSTWAGTIDNVTVKVITPSNVVFALNQSDGTTGIEMRSGGIGKYNTFIGSNAGKSNTTGQMNTTIGDRTLYSNTTGQWNNAIGEMALYSNTSGFSNSAIGWAALFKNTTGYYNNAIGNTALKENTTGYHNNAMGTQALNSNTTGNYNSAMGSYALYYNTTGIYNSATGVYALYSNTTGSNNTGLGYGSGFSNQTGSSNVFLGYQSGYYEAGSNKLFIDNQKRASEADGRTKALLYGIFDASVANQYLTVNGQLQVTGTGNSYINGNVGIGTTTPGAKLSVEGGSHIGGVSDPGDNNLLVDGTIQGSYKSSDGSAGLTTTVTVKGSDGNNCNLTYKNGLLTATTCP